MKYTTPDGYPYLYETHLHTSESSACAVDTAVDMAKAHREAGYTGIIITDHNWGGNTCVDRSLSWTAWVDRFFEPYYRAKEWADANDFQVFPSYEAGYDGTEFMIFGLEVEWIRNHPELHDATVEEQFEIVHKGGGIVVHAHPFREDFYIKEIRLFPEYVDAIEAINATHSSPYAHSSHTNTEYNTKALEYSYKHGFAITGGSDVHSVHTLGGGMAFGSKLASINDFTERVTKSHDYVVADGLRWYDAFGRPIEGC